MNQTDKDKKQKQKVIKSNAKGLWGFMKYFLKQKIFIAYIFLLIILFVLFAYSPVIFEQVDKFYLLNLFGMTAILMFTVILYRGIIAYLNEDYLNVNSRIDKSGAPMVNIQGETEGKTFHIKQETNLVITDDEKRQLFHEIVENVKSEVGNQFETTFTPNPESYRYKEVKKNFERIQDRINSEINSLNRKSNVNLGIGVTTTFAAILILFYANYIMVDKEFTDWQQFFFFFIPKVSIAIFLEIFSFYFLAIYKANLNEIKYYQNELSDIDFKNMVYQSALLTENYNVEELGNKLITSNRNSILKGDELTIDLKRTQVENELLKDFLNKMPNVNELFKTEKKKNSD